MSYDNGGMSEQDSRDMERNFSYARQKENNELLDLLVAIRRDLIVRAEVGDGDQFIVGLSDSLWKRLKQKTG